MERKPLKQTVPMSFTVGNSMLPLIHAELEMCIEFTVTALFWWIRFSLKDGIRERVLCFGCALQ